MISFSKLGEFGRLGNQLFQYAYLRSQAKRLGTKFYCPPWLGDDIFVLDDASEKCATFQATHVYREDMNHHGFSQEAASIEDGTEVEGYFQTEKFFDRRDVTTWFSFKESTIQSVGEKYAELDLSNATALHVRLGDYTQLSLMFYTPTPTYFKHALEVIKPTGPILVFSEDAEMAKEYLGEMPSSTRYMTGNKDYEDFYLMAKCRNVVCSPSSFSWWAAYLNQYPDKKVVMPEHWFIPTGKARNKDIFVDGWVRIPGHRLIADNYYVRYARILLKKLRSFV